MATLSNPPLDRWHKIVNDHDAQELQAMLAEDVVFRSPFLWEPYHGREAAWRILTTVSDVLEDFVYQREVIDQNTWALEFSARVGDLPLHGVDLIRLDDDQRIIDFEVFIRPANGLRALGLEMTRRLRDQPGGT